MAGFEDRRARSQGAWWLQLLAKAGDRVSQSPACARPAGGLDPAPTADVWPGDPEQSAWAVPGHGVRRNLPSGPRADVLVPLRTLPPGQVQPSSFLSLRPGVSTALRLGTSLRRCLAVSAGPACHAGHLITCFMSPPPLGPMLHGGQGPWGGHCRPWGTREEAGRHRARQHHTTRSSPCVCARVRTRLPRGWFSGVSTAVWSWFSGVEPVCPGVAPPPRPPSTRSCFHRRSCRACGSSNGTLLGATLRASPARCFLAGPPQPPSAVSEVRARGSVRPPPTAAVSRVHRPRSPCRPLSGRFPVSPAPFRCPEGRSAGRSSHRSALPGKAGAPAAHSVAHRTRPAPADRPAASPAPADFPAPGALGPAFLDHVGLRPGARFLSAREPVRAEPRVSSALRCWSPDVSVRETQALSGVQRLAPSPRLGRPLEAPAGAVRGAGGQPVVPPHPRSPSRTLLTHAIPSALVPGSLSESYGLRLFQTQVWSCSHV